MLVEASKASMEGVLGENIAILFDLFIMTSAVKNIGSNIKAGAVIAGELIEWRRSRALVTIAMERNTFHVSIMRKDTAYRLGVTMEVYDD